MNEFTIRIIALTFTVLLAVIVYFLLRGLLRIIKRRISRFSSSIEENKVRKRNRERKYMEQRKGSVIKNVDKYREYTQRGNWEEIFRLNSTEISDFGTKKELEVLADYLEEGEVVFALVSGVMSQSVTSNEFDFGLNTWVAVLTSERVLCLDHALFSHSVDTQSIRLDRIQAVSSSQGWALGKVMVDIGNRMIKIDNCVKAHVSVFADLANQLLKKREIEQVQAISKGVNIVDELERLEKLKEVGVINEDEFVLAKQKIVNN